MPPSNGTDRPQDRDRYGFDDATNPLVAALGKFVPQSVVRRSLSVTVETDRERYAPGESVELTVTIENSLPLPVVVETETRRLWGWTVNGELDASDERVYVGDAAGTLAFRAKERKVVSQTWSGRFKRVSKGCSADDRTASGDDRTRWVEPEPGVHEVGAFVNVPGEKPRDSVEVRIGDEVTERT